jgi:hypothetical protein
MVEYLAPLLGGLAGTVVMTIFLLLPRWLNIGNVDVIRAVGVLLTRRVDGAFQRGLALHCVSGIVFAYIYKAVLGLSGIPLTAVSGAFVGGIHGVVVMILVCIVVMEHHPVMQYHERGPMTGLMQLMAHVLYGATVGLVVQSLGASG